MQTPAETLNQQKVIAIILCLFLLFMYKESVWDPYFHPERFRQQVRVVTQPAPEAARPDSPDRFADPAQTVAAVVPNQPATAPATAVPQPATTYPSDTQVASGGMMTLRSSVMSIELSLLGGRVTKLELPQYRSTVEKDARPLNLVEHVEFAPYPLGIYSGSVNDAWVQYRVVEGPAAGSTTDMRDGQKTTIALEGSLPDGRTIRKAITVDGGSYFIDVAAVLSAPSSDASRASIEWTKLIKQDSPDLLDPYHISGLVWFDGQKALREVFGNITADGQSFPDIRWVAMADKYFMAGLISSGEKTTGRALKTGDLYRARLEGGSAEVRARLYTGPKSYRMLESAGYELQRVIDFGWTGVIAAPLLTLLHSLFALVGNYGLAIVLLTIIVKLLVYPLNSSAFKQMRAMQDIAPELKRIKETVSDPRQQQLAMMELYKERGVNPLGGCLPILVQMPIFIGLYSALLLAIELRHAPFAFWITDLSSEERLMIGSIGIPVMVFLFVISMLVQQWMTPSNLDPVQKKVMLAMPVVFGFMFANMPAGLTLYWLTNNVISIGQQAALRNDRGARSAFLVTLALAAAVFIFATILVLASRH